jgi:hypothetical protein
MVDHRAFLLAGDVFTLSCHQMIAGAGELDKVKAVAEGSAILAMRPYSSMYA